MITSIAIFFTWHGLIKFSIWNGIRYYENQNYAKGISNLERATQFYPKKIGKFHIMLAEMYLNIDNTKEALNHANIAKNINPNHISSNQILDLIKNNGK